MTWIFSFDPARDAVTGRADGHPGSPLLVPVRDWFELVLDADDPSLVLGATLELSAGVPVDLRVVEGHLGASVAQGFKKALRLIELESPSSAWKMVHDADVDVEALLRRSRLLQIQVTTAGWTGNEEGGMSRVNVPDVVGPYVNRETMADAEELLDEVLLDGTQGRAIDAIRRIPRILDADERITVIPSDEPLSCTDLLIALCFDKDDLERRFNEALKHLAIHCPNTKLVVLVTSKWSPKTWRRVQADVRALLVPFVILMVGPEEAISQIR